MKEAPLSGNGRFRILVGYSPSEGREYYAYYFERLDVVEIHGPSLEEDETFCILPIAHTVPEDTVWGDR